MLHNPLATSSLGHQQSSMSSNHKEYQNNVHAPFRPFRRHCVRISEIFFLPVLLVVGYWIGYALDHQY